MSSLQSNSILSRLKAVYRNVYGLFQAFFLEKPHKHYGKQIFTLAFWEASSIEWYRFGD